MAKTKSKISGSADPAEQSASEVKTKLWYPYIPLEGFPSFLVYAGAPLELPVTDPQPANTSEWKPNDKSDKHLSLWDAELEAWRVEPDITQAKFSQLQQLAVNEANMNLQIAEDALNGSYPQTERNSWPQQIAEANAIIAGTNTADSTPLLTALSKARVMDINTLAKSVIAKSNAYNTEYGSMLAEFQTARDKIAGAKVFADLPVIPLNFLRTLSL